MRRINSGCGGVLDKQRRWGFVMAVEVFQWQSRTKRGDDGGGQRRWLWTAMLAVMAVIGIVQRHEWMWGSDVLQVMLFDDCRRWRWRWYSAERGGEGLNLEAWVGMEEEEEEKESREKSVDCGRSKQGKKRRREAVIFEALNIVTNKTMAKVIPPPPPCTHSSDVVKLKKREKVLTRHVNMFMKLFRSDEKFSQMLTQHESQPEIGGGSGSGGRGDDEQEDDEDDGEDGEDEDDS
ncbi:hypothetical protein Tco_0032116 [Tanacetum coccineum]